MRLSSLIVGTACSGTVAALVTQRAALTATSTPTSTRLVHEPDTTYEPWTCATKNMSSYLRPPMPTGKLLDGLDDYGAKIYEECERTLSKPFTTFPACVIGQDQWCAFKCTTLTFLHFSTAVPSSLSSEYKAYTSSASSWWSVNKPKIMEAKEDCPNTWHDTTMDIPAGVGWLNVTIAFAECKADNNKEKKPDAPATPVTSSALSGAKSGASATPVATGSNASAATGGGVALEMGLWKFAGAILVTLSLVK